MQAQEWLAELGASGLAADTIKGYRSAMSTRHAIEHAHDSEPARNPWSAEGTSRLLAGVAKQLRTADRARRASLGASISMDPYTTMSVSGAFAAGSDEHLMQWAAITMGAFGMLRPGELLGSSRKPESTPMPSSITFFARAHSRATSTLPAASAPAGAAPFSYSIDLGTTKADQRGLNPHTIIEQPEAVGALWRWMHRRQAIPHTAALFAIGRQRLSTARLNRLLELALAAAGHANPHVTGKCFRRGGAGALAAAGTPEAAIAAAGRWATARMYEKYAGARALALRVTQSMSQLAPRGASPRRLGPGGAARRRGSGLGAAQVSAAAAARRRSRSTAAPGGVGSASRPSVQ